MNRQLPWSFNLFRSIFSLGFLSALFLSTSLMAAETPVKTMVIFGDSLSDNGNTTHLLKSLRRDENPSYLVHPLKTFVINRMTEFADDYYVPQIVLDAGLELVHHFFDEELAPLLVSIIGKVKKVPVIPGAPYWQSHFSNGRVWNEYLAPMLSIDREAIDDYSNQAFGGSWSATYDYQLTTWNLIRHPLGTLKTLIVGKLIPPSLGLTIQAYLLINQQVDSESTYFVFSGGNDYLNVLFFEDNYNDSVMGTYVDNVTGSISAGIEHLMKAGAKHIVVLGLPDIGISPKFVHTLDGPILTEAVNGHNLRLQDRLATLRETAPDVDLLYIDTQKILAKTLEHPSDYGFTNISDACIDVKLPMFSKPGDSPFARNYVLQYAQVLEYIDPGFKPGEKNYHVCEQPENYLFWDQIHPTTRAHQYLAYEICAAMKEHGYKTNCQKPVNP